MRRWSSRDFFSGDPRRFEFDFQGLLAVGFAVSIIGSMRGLRSSGRLVGVLADGTSVVLANINKADEIEVLTAFECFRAGTRA
jgi:hypothetical protein